MEPENPEPMIVTSALKIRLLFLSKQINTTQWIANQRLAFYLPTQNPFEKLLRSSATLHDLTKV